VTRLQDAVRDKLINVVKTLLEAGDDPNQEHGALRYSLDNMELAQMLVAYGADVNGDQVFYKTLLHQAIDRANVEMVEYLISNGASALVRDNNGNNLLHYIAEGEIVYQGPGGGEAAWDERASRLLQICTRLIREGVQINEPNVSGDSPLHLAMKNPNGYWHLTKLLMQSVGQMCTGEMARIGRHFGLPSRLLLCHQNTGHPGG